MYVFLYVYIAHIPLILCCYVHRSVAKVEVALYARGSHTLLYMPYKIHTYTVFRPICVCVCICFCEIPIVSYGPRGPRADGGVGGTVELLHMLQNIYVSCKEFALKAASSGRSAAAAAAAAATSW